MKHASFFFSFIIAASCLITPTDSKSITTTQAVVLGSLIGSSYLLITREATKGFTPRYSVKKIAEVRSLLSKDYALNLWYLFYDGLIGQQGKTSKDTFGVLGTTYYHLMPLKKAASNVAFGYMFYQMGLKIDKDIEKLAKHRK